MENKKISNKMKKNITVLFVLTFGFAYGQDFSYPSINAQGKDVENFIP